MGTIASDHSVRCQSELMDQSLFIWTIIKVQCSLTDCLSDRIFQSNANRPVERNRDFPLFARCE